MNYSYLMGIKDITKLKDEVFIIDEIDGDYGIKFEKSKEKVYEDFVIENLEPGYWNEYLENVEFNIDDYESTCKYYTEDSLSIELKATEQDGKIITYEIPLVLNDNCDSTSS